MKNAMKPLFLFAILLLATVPVARAGETIILRIRADAKQKFHAMMDKNQLREGMNLIVTEASGNKVWANLKKEGQFAVVDWVITDRAGKRLETTMVNIQFVSPRSEEKWQVCPKGPDDCHDVPCVPKFPCCQKDHKMWCCIE
jgi:hypothetical protein